MQDWVIQIIEQFGYIGIFLMMALENIFPPIPSEVILLFGGFMTTKIQLNVVGVAITSVTGSVFGAIVLYGIGRIMKVERLEKIIDRWGSVFRVQKKDIQKADEWFNRYGHWTVLLCRMIPLVRSLISIPAGMSKMKFSVFLLFTIIGTVVWNIIFIVMGVTLGETWSSVLQFMDTYSTLAYIIIGTGIVLFLFLFIWKKNIRNR